MRPQILLVEDEPSIADNIVYALKTEGFDPVWCQTGGDALARFRDAKGAVSLVILDVGLPDMNGFELCKMLRSGSAVPIIFVTARKDEIDRVVGLEIGADDYVVKPFSPRELTARVRAILRRAHAPAQMPGPGPGPASAPGAAGPGQQAPGPPGERRSGERDVASSGAPGISATPAFAIDEERCEIRFHGAALQLSRYEFRLLKVLVQKPGRVYSREQLMELAWDEPEAALDRTVDAHIKMLRAKLRAVREEEDPIRTHRGLGYSLKEDPTSR